MVSYPEESSYKYSPSFWVLSIFQDRHESNLTSLPIQDLEVFVRAYLYQLGLQAAFFLMGLLCRNSQNSDDVDALSRNSVAMIISKILYAYGVSERKSICNVSDSSLKMEVYIWRQRRILRIPETFAEPGFISEPRSGAFLRDLRRFSFLSHMKFIVENALYTILAGNELLQES